MHFIILIAIMAIVTFCYAQIRVVSIALPGWGPQPLMGSELASDATATTYYVACTAGAKDCANLPLTITEGPAIAAYTSPPKYETTDGSVALALTEFQSCSLAGTTSAVCVQSYGGFQAASPGQSTVTFSEKDMGYMPLALDNDMVTSTASALTTQASVSGTFANAGEGSGMTRETDSASKTSTGSHSTPVSTAVSTRGASAATYSANSTFALMVFGGAAMAIMALGT